MIDLPNLMLAKVSHYTVATFSIGIILYAGIKLPTRICIPLLLITNCIIIVMINYAQVYSILLHYGVTAVEADYDLYNHNIHVCSI